MYERFVQGSLPEKAAWIALGVLLFFGAIAFWFHFTPPSSWFGWSNESTAEWLGWIGAIGLVFAIWQLAVTASTAQQIKTNVADAVERLDGWDVSHDLRAISEELIHAQRYFGARNLLGAATSCGRAEVLLFQTKVHYTRLPQASKDVIDRVWAQVGSASLIARSGGKEFTRDVRREVTGTLHDLQDELAGVLAQLRG